MGVYIKRAYEVNSKEYWDFRLKNNWDWVGGSSQTYFFAVGFIMTVPDKRVFGSKSVLDFGCGLGDSAAILQVAFPEARLILHDHSEAGVDKGIRKYGKYLKVSKWDKREKAELVYCSNVIEHVQHPKEFVNSLIESSTDYVCIQCPWNELHVNGKKISPEAPLGEHIWTIDQEFFDRYIDDERVSWSLIKNTVEMSWPGGSQAYYWGQIIK